MCAEFNKLFLFENEDKHKFKNGQFVGSELSEKARKAIAKVSDPH